MRVDIGCNPFVPELHLFHSRKKHMRFCDKKFGGHSDMETCAQTDCDGEVAAVLFDPSYSTDLASDFAMLAHEAYHVACMRLKYLSEDDYGEETMAYLVQVIAGSLCQAHMTWLEKRRGTNG